MTGDNRRRINRKNPSCTCEWHVKFSYGVAFTLAVFEAKRLLVVALEIFAEWQVIRFAGGFQPIALTLAEMALGLPSALLTVRTIRRRNLPSFRLKAKLMLRCLLIIIIVCTAMNTATLASIGYHVSVRQKTLVDVFNTSMRLYVSVTSYKYAIDEIQFVLQCCGHTSYTDWFHFDWQRVDYASREEMAGQSRISDEDYRYLGVPFSCCNLRVVAPCMHMQITDDKTINVNGCAEVISPILLRIVIVAYVMTSTLIIIQVLLIFLITRMVCRFVPLQTSSQQVRCTAVPFTIINTIPRTYVQRFSSVKKSTWRKRTMHRHPLSTNVVCIKENQKLRLPRRNCSILNSRNYNTWDVAKIKPSVHEEHKISVECFRNKRTR
ncbi:peripherin-2-like [Nylanderia fulva]|uniref:peripherin-2-like n=1 Tax=Nylanderia fulva TaxID=613905 RepID=UPI0010FB7BE1|nr:peripherin-2-like [Nylanderia fulva]